MIKHKIPWILILIDLLIDRHSFAQADVSGLGVLRSFFAVKTGRNFPTSFLVRLVVSALLLGAPLERALILASGGEDLGHVLAESDRGDVL